MNLETKVGIFIILGFLVAGLGVMKLSDVRLGNRYTLYFVFKDVQGLREKSLIKVAGVEIGTAEKVELENGKAKITARINENVAVYANAKVRVNLVGLIGSQFVDLEPGTPEAARLKDGDTLYGQTGKSLNDLIEKLSDLFEGKDGKPGMGDDLKATAANLRSVSDSLNYAIGRQREELKDMVKNFHDFSADLKGMASDIHELTSKHKEDLDVAITKLRSIIERVDDILGKVQRGEGAVGKLVADKEMGEEVKRTVSNLKETSQSAKEVLGRFTKVRSYWEFQLRNVPAASAARADAGLRLAPRDNKYYRLGVNNIGDRKDEFKDEGDYEKKNTIDAVLGKQWGPVTFELGALRSSGGVGVKYYPFLTDEKQDDGYGQTPLSRIELNSQAFDFTRDETRGLAGRERRFNKPQVNLGARYRVARWLDVGAGVEDVAEVSQFNVATHLIFEDRDLAYLFGFVSFAR